MDTKKLLTIVNANGFSAKGLYLLETLDEDGYENATQGLDIIEVIEGVTLVDYKSEYAYITPFAIYIKEGKSYALYIDEADKDLI